MVLISPWVLTRLWGVCVLNFLLPVYYLEDLEVICVLEKCAIKTLLQAKPHEYLDLYLYDK